mgnify:CR=1 FL=1
MAGRSVKKKNSTAPLKKAVTLIAVFVVLLFTVLDLTGLVSFDSLLSRRNTLRQRCILSTLVRATAPL